MRLRLFRSYTILASAYMSAEWWQDVRAALDRVLESKKKGKQQ